MKIIDEKQIAHLMRPKLRSEERIEYLLGNTKLKTFGSPDRDSLLDAYTASFTDENIVLTMPQIIAARTLADSNSILRWSLMTDSQETTGVDERGVLAKKGEHIALFMHGCGPIEEQELREATHTSNMHDLLYDKERFDSSLEGWTPHNKVKVYSIDQARREEIEDPFGKYAIWMPLEKALDGEYPYLSKKEFMNNDLVLARAGTPKYLEEYHELFKKNHKAKSYVLEFDAHNKELHPDRLRADLLEADNNGSITRKLDRRNANYAVLEGDING